jgi:hypothetical protein
MGLIGANRRSLTDRWWKDVIKMKLTKIEGAPRVRALRPDAGDVEARGVNDSAGETAVGEVEEMAFTRQSDLDAYARGLSIPPEVIEKWISAGLLFPDEIRMAEKIIKILREKIKVS